MKKLISFTLSLLFLFLLQGQAQNYSKASFDFGTLHTSLDYVYFNRIIHDGDSHFIYFNTERRGIINNSEENGYVTLKGLLELVVSSEGQVGKLTHRYFEHESVTRTKNLYYYTNPFSENGPEKEVLASKDNIIEEDPTAIKAIFPNYYKDGDGSSEEEKKLQVYYENKIKYSGMRKGVTSFLNGTYSLRTEDTRGKLAKFVMEEGSEYTYDRNLITIDNYRNTDKETCWFTAEEQACDAVTGLVYGANRKIMKKGKFRNYQEYEFVVFDKDAEVVSRIEKKFKIPVVNDKAFTLKKKNEEGFNQIDKRIYLLKDCDLIGTGARKEFGNQLKTNRRHILEVKADGTEDEFHTIMPEDNTDYFYAYRNAAGQSTLIGRSYPLGLDFLTLTDSEKPQRYTFSLNDDLMTSFNFEGKDAKGYSWTVIRNEVLDNGHRVLVFRLSDKVRVPAEEAGVGYRNETHYVGWFCVITDGSGKPIKSHRIEREGEGMTKKGQFFFVGETADYVKYMIKDPMANGRIVKMLKINKSDNSLSEEIIDKLTNANYMVRDGVFYLIGEKPYLYETREDYPETKMVYKLYTSKI